MELMDTELTPLCLQDFSILKHNNKKIRFIRKVVKFLLLGEKPSTLNKRSLCHLNCLLEVAVFNLSFEFFSSLYIVTIAVNVSQFFIVYFHHLFYTEDGK